MRDAFRLREDARRAYERGRFRAALRVGVVILPVTVLVAWETAAVARTFVLALGLWALASIFRWRLAQGFDTVNLGLQFGAVPLAVALVLCRFAPSCPPDVAIALCGSTGSIGGAFLGRELSAGSTVCWTRWTAAAVVSAMMATLGCLALGIGSAVGAAAGLAGGAAVAARWPRRSFA